MKTLYLLLFCCLLQGFSYATNVPAGTVSGVWSQTNSPYNVLGDITVLATDTLIIQPGVTVKFANGAQLICNGKFSAEGAEEDSIRFEALDQNWNGMAFHPITQFLSDTLNLKFCVFTDMTLDGLYITYVANIQHCRFSNNLNISNGAANFEGSHYFIRNCHFTNNTPYAAKFASCQSVMDSCSFIGRSTLLYDNNHAAIEPTINHCHFNGMDLPQNEAIRIIHYSDVVIQNSEICHYKSDTSSSIHQEIGGSLATSLENCHIHHNESMQDGGAIHMNSFLLYLTNCLMEENLSHGNGGAISCQDMNGANNIFRNNVAYLNGGALTGNLLQNAHNFTFEGNSAGQYGGAIFGATNISHIEAYNNYALRGGAIYFQENLTSIPTFGRMDNCILYNNNAEQGSAIFSNLPIIAANNLIANNLCEGGGSVNITAADSSRFVNCIFYGNENDLEMSHISTDHTDAFSLTVIVQNSVVQNGINSIELATDDILVYENNFEDDPLFVNPSNEVGVTAGLEYIDWRVFQGSICIDSGISTDEFGFYYGNKSFDWIDRPLSAQYDIGPFEGSFLGVLGDFNGDGELDDVDLAMLMGNSGCFQDCDLYDLDGNGIIGAGDVILWMGLYQ